MELCHESHDPSRFYCGVTSSSLHRFQHVVHDVGVLTLRAEQDDP
jgi:hypothetical protein